MNEVIRLLSAVEQGDPRAAGQLLPLVYEELRQLAAARLAQEKPGQTLDATALVHEAYLRLTGPESAQHFSGRGHFFAAAEAMRRILVENARRRAPLALRAPGWPASSAATRRRNDDPAANPPLFPGRFLLPSAY